VKHPVNTRTKLCSWVRGRSRAVSAAAGIVQGKVRLGLGVQQMVDPVQVATSTLVERLVAR